MFKTILHIPITLLFLLALLLSSMAVTAQEITIGTYRFRDGGEYQGEIFRGKPYGKG